MRGTFLKVHKMPTIGMHVELIWSGMTVLFRNSGRPAIALVVINALLIARNV